MNEHSDNKIIRLRWTLIGFVVGIIFTLIGSALRYPLFFIYPGLLLAEFILFFVSPLFSNSYIFLPLCNVLVYTAFGTTIGWILTIPRPFPEGHCKNCDYNLTGNESGVCPECGTEIKT